MAEKKMHENRLPETQNPEDPKEMARTAPSEAKNEPQEPKGPVAAPEAWSLSAQCGGPNEVYRRLLPAVLFLITFLTVMTMLLIYMDTVALGAAQFRLNMSRDYELARIPQESPKLVAFVRQLHLAPRAPAARKVPIVPQPTERNRLLDSLYGEIVNGTFIEWLPSGGRDPTVQYLESARQWSGVVVRPGARDYLSLRGGTPTLHACLSTTNHPREVTYLEAESSESMFRPRVLCLPLYTVLLAAQATHAHYVLLAGAAMPHALHHLPFHTVHLQVIDYRSSDPVSRNDTTVYLTARNYSVAALYPDGVMYTLNEAH